ncbi:MAG: Hpt domain-containing protein, partial [Deinococcota bacterium]
MTMSNINNSSANDELLENFLIDGWEALGSYDQATLSLADCFQEDNLKDLRVVSHRIKGTAALYGYTQISQLAEMVERILTNAIPDEAQAEVAQFLEQVGVCLHSALEHLARDGREPNLGLELAHMGGTELLSNLLKRHPEAFLRPPDEAEQLEGDSGQSLSAQAVAFKDANLDIWEYFPLEAGEHIAAMRESLDNLSDPRERQGGSTSVTALFRAAHTLKGSAYMVDFGMMGDFAHELEDLMDLVREAKIPLDDAVIALLRRGTNTLEAMLAAAEGLPNRLEQDLPELQTLLAARLGKPSPSQDGSSADGGSADGGSADGGSADSAAQDADKHTDKHAVSRALRNFQQANDDIWEYFPLEVVDNIAIMRDSLALARSEADERRPDATSVTSLFRAAHTIKGSSYMVDLRRMGDFAKELEALMDLVRKGERPLDEATAELLGQGIDVLEAMLLAAEGESTSIDTLLGPAEVAFASTLGHELKQGQGADSAQVSSAQLSSNLRIFFQENQDVWEYFAPEAREHIDAMRNALIVAEADVRAGNNVDNDTITQLFRVAHTLKGSAYMVGFEDLGSFAHKLEELMSAVRENDMPFSSEVHDTLMSGMQVLEQMLRSAEGEGAGLEVLLFDTEQQLANLLGTEPPVAATPADTPQAPTDQPELAPKPATTATIRVSLDKLDALMNLAGDMVMARSRLLRRLSQLDTTIKLLAGSHERMLRISGDFEERYINPRFSAEGEAMMAQASAQVAVAAPAPVQLLANPANGHLPNPQPDPTPARYADESFKTSVSGLFDELEFDTYDDLNILARTISEMTLDITEIQNQFNVIDRGLRGEVDTIQSITRDLRQQISRSRMVPIGRVFSRLTRL